ncbi:FAD-dependent oxidoreductase [uncultured Oscillibacter sp.]|uniref:FAD-dependent oxidoreductase n=1 Tax=uncultured Oscillibacter sp. TaxID=876091 RepID=UPI0025EA5C08|nr:FAD-dependent oxidoreductase [uncultured Oscillibacter sp.]
MESIWSRGTELPRFPSLQGDCRTDVLVIGGGLAGLLCARRLTELGVENILVEADALCGGITKDTTAKITSQHGLIYDKLLRQFGAERAGMYLQANQAAVREYRRLCTGIDCGFEEKDAFVYSRSDRRKLEQELRALEALGVSAELKEETPLPFSTAGAVRFPGQAQFDPLRFAAAISKGLRIYEHTPVLELGPCVAATPAGKIRAEKMIVCTHFPFLNKHGSYFLKMYQRRSYVLALENAADVAGMYVDEAEDGLSLRNAGELLLLGGGGHRTGGQGGGWKELKRCAARYYPASRERARWAAQDCMTLDGVPYVGPYSARTQGLYVATGFNKWGMTSSMAAAMLLGDLVTGRENPWAPVFSPSRTILRPQLAVNAAEAVLSLLKPARPRCPHMGCALKWNPQERTWDCPCHGSRFTREGRLIDNPATGDLKGYKSESEPQ